MSISQDIALRLYDGGFAVVPPREDGTKRPLGTWRQYTNEPPDRATVAAWYAAGRDGIGIVCGASSGNLEMLEIEGSAVAEGMAERFYEAAKEAGCYDLLADIANAYMEVTPSGGIHWYYRVEGPVAGNTKLARRELGVNDDGVMIYETLIETRGQGGYSVTAPSGGRVHKTGEDYRVVAGEHLSDVLTITTDERDQLHALGRQFNEVPEPEPSTPAPALPRAPRPLGSSSWMDDLVDDYNRRTTWSDVLTGWVLSHSRGGEDYWVRPGKDAKDGHSATTNSKGTDRLIVFSSSVAPGLEVYDGTGPTTSYDRFSFTAITDFGGQRVDAARALRDQGYGPPPPPEPAALGSGLQQAAAQPATPAPDEPAPSPGGQGGRQEPPPGDDWPVLPDAAMHGPIGSYVRLAAPYTEADPVAILAQLLAGVGAIANSGHYVLAGNDRHPASLFVAIVGATASAKKGTSWAGARIVLDHIDHEFTRRQIIGGFGSGEALIETMADREQDGDGKDDQPVRAKDTRTLIYEGELASILAVASREKSTFGQTIRNGWDGKPLAARTRGRGTSVAENYHLSIIGHITIEELRSTLSDRDTYGGTTNRFLWVAARRARRLPEGGNIPDNIALAAARTLSANLAEVRRHSLYHRTPAAAERWAVIYDEMCDDEPPGLLGAAIARVSPQVARLSLTYAIADGASEIDLVHVEAAWAFWQYCRATAEHIFPASTALTETVLAGITGAGARGLDRTAMHALLGNNVDARTLNVTVTALIEKGVVIEEKLKPEGGGRPSLIVRLAQYRSEHSG